MKKQNVIAIDGFIDEEGERKPFILTISEPYKNVNESDYHCEIYAPNFFQDKKRIFGATRFQAKRLTINFIKRLLKERRLYDKSGNSVKLE